MVACSAANSPEAAPSADAARSSCPATASGQGRVPQIAGVETPQPDVLQDAGRAKTLAAAHAVRRDHRADSGSC